MICGMRDPGTHPQQTAAPAPTPDPASSASKIRGKPKRLLPLSEIPCCKDSSERKGKDRRGRCETDCKRTTERKRRARLRETGHAPEAPGWAVRLASSSPLTTPQRAQPQLSEPQRTPTLCPKCRTQCPPTARQCPGCQLDFHAPPAGSEPPPSPPRSDRADRGARMTPAEAIKGHNLGDLFDLAGQVLQRGYQESSWNEFSRTWARVKAFEAALPAEVASDEVLVGIIYAATNILEIGNTPSTAHNYWQYIRTGWKISGKEELLRDPRAIMATKALKRMQADQARTRQARPATFEETDSIVTSANPQVALAVATAWLSASRMGDTLHIDVSSDLTLSEDRLRIMWRHRKDWGSQGLAQTVQVPQHWLPILRQAISAGEAATQAQVRAALPRGLGFHSFRRGAAQLVADRSGGDVQLVQSLTLHKEIATLLRYVPDLMRERTLRASSFLVGPSTAPAPTAPPAHASPTAAAAAPPVCSPIMHTRPENALLCDDETTDAEELPSSRHG